MTADWSEVCCGACGTVWDARTPNGIVPTDCPFCGEDGCVDLISDDAEWYFPPVSRNALPDDAAGLGR